MAFRFRYRQVQQGQGPDGARVGRKRPCVPIRLYGPLMTMDIDTVLDSGADVTIIPRPIAEAIGLDLTDAPQSMGGIGGSIMGIPTTATIRIAKGASYRIIDNVPILVPVDRDLGFSLLGREGVFERFKITIDEEKQVVILKPKSTHGRRGR